MGHTSLKKRHRQHTQQERQQAKALRRDQRKQEKPALIRLAGEEDPDLKGMVPGPQRPPDNNEP